jgi:hypothetical protein
LPLTGADLPSQFPDLATICHHLDLGMRSADATAVDKLLVFLGRYDALHGPLADCALLHNHGVVFYVLFVISNGELKFDIPMRVTALWALSNLVLGSDLARRGSIVGMSDDFFITPKDAADVRQKALDSFPVQPLRDQFSAHEMSVCGELMTFAKQYNLIRFCEICLQHSFGLPDRSGSGSLASKPAPAFPGRFQLRRSSVGAPKPETSELLGKPSHSGVH